MFDKYNNTVKPYLNVEMILVSIMGKYGFKFIKIEDNGAHDKLYFKQSVYKITFAVNIDSIALIYDNRKFTEIRTDDFVKFPKDNINLIPINDLYRIITEFLRHYFITSKEK